MYVHVYVYIYIYTVNINMYIHMCIYTYVHTTYIQNRVYCEHPSAMATEKWRLNLPIIGEGT